MRTIKFILTLFVFSAAVSGCYTDKGQTEESNTKGYDLYTNKTINISVLTPRNWVTYVTIGGEYVIRTADSEDAAFYIASSPVKFLMGESASESTTLEEFKKYRLAQINEENIGPELSISTNKNTLSGHDAYEIFYSYLPAEWIKRNLFKRLLS